MRSAMIALMTMYLCGCAVGVKAVHGPDGQQAHAITCSALGRDWSDCFERAGQICGARGYKVWNQSASQSAIISGDQDSIFGGTSEERTLLIGCKEATSASAATTAGPPDSESPLARTNLSRVDSFRSRAGTE